MVPLLRISCVSRVPKRLVRKYGNDTCSVQPNLCNIHGSVTAAAVRGMHHCQIVERRGCEQVPPKSYTI